jgi:autotransporter-associated beta strand protein
MSTKPHSPRLARLARLAHPARPARLAPLAHRAAPASIASLLVLALALAFALAPPLHAQTSGTWNSATNGDWGAAGNWSPASVPGLTAGQYDTAEFSDLLWPSGTRTVTVASTYNLNRLDLTANYGQTLLLTGAGGLVLGGPGAGIFMPNNVRLTFDTNLTLAADATLFNAQSSNVIFTAARALNLASFTLTVESGNAGARTRVDSTISGAGGIIKTGAGYLELSGVNTFTGGVKLHEGILRINHNNALGNTASSILEIGDGLAPSSLVAIELADTSITLNNPFIWNNDLGVKNATSFARSLTFAYNGTVTLDNNYIRLLDVGDASIEVIFGSALRLDGTGGIQLKGGNTSRVTFLNGNNIFSGGYIQHLKQVTVGTGSGDITLGALAAGQNYIGIGDVTVGSGDDILYLNPGAPFTARLLGNIYLNWGAVLDVTNGSVLLDGALLSSGPNPGSNGANRIIVRGNPTCTDASFAGSPDLYVTTPSSLTISGAGMKTGLGRLIMNGAGAIILGPTAANISAGEIRLETGALSLGAHNQILSGTFFMGPNTRLNANGYDATFSDGIAWGAGIRYIDFGPTAPSGANTLNFGPASTNPAGAGVIYIQNWRAGVTHLNFDNTTAASWVNNFYFDSYNWSLGTQFVSNPSGGFDIIPTTFVDTGTYVWTGAASHSAGTGPVFNNWSAPGNWHLNRYPAFGAGKTILFTGSHSYTPNLTLPGAIRTGNLIFNMPNTNFGAILSSGTIIFDSGIAGVSATMAKSRDDYNGYIYSAIRLDSNLVLARADTLVPYGSLYARNLAGLISNSVSGTTITVTGGAWNLSNTGNTFTGNLIVNGGLIRLASSGTFNSMGSGTLFMNGGVLWGREIYNPAVFSGTFAISADTTGATGYTYFRAAGGQVNNIPLIGNVHISGTQSSTGGWGGAPYLIFEEGRNLVGSGGLTFAGYWYSNGLITYAGDSVFTGGFTMNSTGGWPSLHIHANTGTSNGSLVYGDIAPGRNYLGIRDITLANGTVVANARSTGTHVFLNGVTMSISNGYYQANSAPTHLIDSSTLRLTGNNGIY